MVDEYNVEISEELAEHLSPSKQYEGRSDVLQRLANSLGQRGHYHLAAKKLTQAGDKVKNRLRLSMRCCQDIVCLHIY